MEPMRILRIEGMAFVVLLSALLAYRLLTREINLDGLLRNRRGAPVSPERVQLLVATIAVSFKFLATAMHGTGNSLPEVDAATLSVFGASSGVYAGVKALRAIRMRQDPAMRRGVRAR